MSLVGLANTRISTDYAQKSSRSLLPHLRHENNTTKAKNWQLMNLTKWPFNLRVGLDYSEEVYGRSRIPAQDESVWSNHWYGKQDGKTNYILFFQVGVLQRSTSSLRVWGCPRNLTSGELPLQKVFRCWHSCHFSIHAWSTPYQRSLYHDSVNPGWQRTHFIANRIAPFP